MMAIIYMIGYQVFEPEQMGIVPSDYIIIIFQSYVQVIKTNCVLLFPTCLFTSIYFTHVLNRSSYSHSLLLREKRV